MSIRTKLRGDKSRVATVKVACHCTPSSSGAGTGAPVVALAGSPNVGKSTLFNALTGAGVQMGNWPGTTVEVARGAWRPALAGGREAPAITLVDLPGTYSVDAHSPDELLARDLLLAEPVDERPDLTVVVIDGAQLARTLYLLAGVREHTMRLVVAVTMLDVATERGLRLDLKALSKAVGCPVVAVDPRHRTGLTELTAAVLDELAKPATPARPVAPGTDELDRDDDRFAFIQGAVDVALTRPPHLKPLLSDRVDRILTAPYLGGLIFLVVMFLVFEITTTVAAPMQDWLDKFFSGPVSEGATALLGWLGVGDGWFAGLIVNGLIAGVGMLLTFLPLMALMFILLALLEDSGYLARAAVVTDRAMRRLGLPGRAFLPLVVGFGCNVPAISATRVLPGAKQRILTALLIPFTSCTARLTVYVLLASIFFGKWAGVAVFVMYVISILLILCVGLLLRKTLWRNMGHDPLILDLPPYQRPTLRLVSSVTWQRLKGFLKTAGGIIVITVTVVWLLQSIPARGDGSFAHLEPHDSAYAVAAEAISPVFAPAGFGNWQTTGTLVVGFVAKEAVIASWAQTYAVEEPDDPSTPGDLGDKLRADFEESSGGHPIAAVWAFLVFLLAYTPCVATLPAQKREIGLRWTMFGVGMQLAVAWILAVGIFQIGRLFL